MRNVACYCGAMFKTEDEQELVQMVKIHGRKTHMIEITDDEARGGINVA